MATKTKTQELTPEQLLEVRNQAVQKAYSAIIKNLTPLLQPFSGQKFRTYIQLDHTKTDKESNLVAEMICSFFNVTISRNKVGYLMLYFRYDDLAFSKFGARLYNRCLRQLFKHSDNAITEDCIRVNPNGKVQDFFLSRLAGGENEYTKISIEEQPTS